MAITVKLLYRNYNSDDIETQSWIVGEPLSSATAYWEAPSGKQFAEWNTERDGTGTGYDIGDTMPLYTLYAIWEDIPEQEIEPDPEPQSRIESILLGNDIEPKSRVEALLKELIENDGDGTSDVAKKFPVRLSFMPKK